MDEASHPPPDPINAREWQQENSEGYPSGQRGQTVNLLAYAFGGSTKFAGSELERDAKRRGPKGERQGWPNRPKGEPHGWGESSTSRHDQRKRQQQENSEGYPSGQRGQTVNLLAYAFGGSNPPPSTSFMQRSRKLRQRSPRCGSSSMVEPQPSKLMVRVRFPSPAPLNCPTREVRC